MSSAFNADLHCHSVVSDGTLTPEALAARAAANGVQLWSLTDHDEVGGQQRAAAAARDLGLAYLTGTEISATFADQTVHIVGLGFDADDPDLLAGLAATRGGRAARGREMAQGLAQVGIPGAWEGALRYAGNPDLVARTHFARFLVDAGVCRDMGEVFRRFLKPGKPGYVEHVWATLEDALGWIHGAGGIAVLAHPGRYRISNSEMDRLFERFRELGGAGVEVACGAHDAGQVLAFARLARKFSLLASRASDYHGPEDCVIELGKAPLLPPDLTPVWTRLMPVSVC